MMLFVCTLYLSNIEILRGEIMKAENCGANCSDCPLLDSRFVLPQKNPNAKIAIVTDHPSLFEVKHQIPLIGPDTRVFTEALSNTSMNREDFYITMSVLCQPPEDNMKKFLTGLKARNRKLKSLNKEREKQGLDLLPMIKTPHECCSARLKEELKDFDKIIPMGSYAIKEVMHKSANIMDLRGAPTIIERSCTDQLESKKVRILPTFHPSMVSKSPKWIKPFTSDIVKAVKWFERGLDWTPPKVIYHPKAKDLREFLWQEGVPYWAYDVETDGIESLTANLRCIGIGTPKAVVIVGLLGIDGRTKFYETQAEEDAVVEVLKEFFTAPNILKMGWNSGYYDRLVIENNFGITPEPHFDAMLFHRLTESELPHSLGFAGSMYSEAPSWKTDRMGRKKAYGSETDFELHEYCAFDVSITAEVLPPLISKVNERNQGECLKRDHSLQGVCAEMHKVGIRIDQDKRREFELRFMNDIQNRRIAIRNACDREDINPASATHLRGILFDEWNLLPYLADKLDSKEYLTATGESGTGDHVMRALLTVSHLTDRQRTLIENVRLFRQSQRILGTYITKLRYNNEYAWGGWDEEDSIWDKDFRDQYGSKKLGIVNPKTNRIHPGYNMHVTVTGRLNSSKPINIKNIPMGLREMIVPTPGNVFVALHMNELELRIAASRWDSQKYLEAFANDWDPHSSVTAYGIFGKRFEDVAIACGAGRYPWKRGINFDGDAMKLRTLSKAIADASQYGANVETVHRMVTQMEVENDDGSTSLPYLNLSVREIRMMHRNWEKVAQYKQGWNEEIQSFRENDYLLEPIMGRRRDFLDGENTIEIVSYPIQGSASSLINIVLLQLRESIPISKWGYGTGIISQYRDSIVVECPEDKAEWVRQVMQECMNLEFDCLPGVKFTAEAELGKTWKDII